MRMQDENPIIDALLEQGYHIEEVRDIIVHIHEEIRMRTDIEEIFDMYGLSLDLLHELNRI
jgi:hypothetical protein